MTTRDAATALRRFGLGSRPGDIQRIAADPRGFVAAQLGQAAAARLDSADLEPSHEVFTAMRAAQREQRQAREATKADGARASAGKAGDGKAGDGGDAMSAAPASPARGPEAGRPGAGGEAPGQSVKPGRIRREAYREEAVARLQKAVATDAPLLERLVMFWSNHFCVSILKGPVRGLAGAYEREAIRPRVLGRFADMLRAVEQHPAMLIYLDNAQSIGPNSQAGQRRARGLNENLAREILELHTVGVNAGYTQEDVTNLARILTGWTVGTPDAPRSEPGRFFFAPQRHEPGSFTVMGRAYQNGSVRSGEQCLDVLAREPATARHIATKLARHFVADIPPPGLVERLERTFRETDGDLGAVTRALVTAPEAWSTSARKIVPPYDFVVGLLRGFGLKPDPGEALRLAGALGQPLWQVHSPKGWPDDDEAWTGPAAIRERLRIAEKASREIAAAADPRAVAEDLLGDTLTPATRQAIARAEAREQGFELLVMSPEMLRR